MNYTNVLSPKTLTLVSVAAITRGQCLTFQILHHQVIDAVLLADIVQGADMRMIEAGNGARLSLETLTQLRLGGEMLGKYFDRDRAV